jgi:hypothetical protein
VNLQNARCNDKNNRIVFRYALFCCLFSFLQNVNQVPAKGKLPDKGVCLGTVDSDSFLQAHRLLSVNVHSRVIRWRPIWMSFAYACWVAIVCCELQLSGLRRRYVSGAEWYTVAGSIQCLLCAPSQLSRLCAIQFASKCYHFHPSRGSEKYN